MTKSLNDRVNEYFTACVRDLTPASARHATKVLYVPVSHDPDVTGFCGSVLSDAELLRAERFANKDDRTRFIQRRAFRRYCGAKAIESPQALAQIVFEETGNGRPYLDGAADTWFSFSSCHTGFLGAWSSTHGVGVDLEDQTGIVEAREVAQQFFSRAEARIVNGTSAAERQWIFLEFWSFKEAALKSIGEGLPFGLENFQFELQPMPRVVHAPSSYGGFDQFDVHAIPGTDACAALVIRKLNAAQVHKKVIISRI